MGMNVHVNGLPDYLIGNKFIHEIYKEANEIVTSVCFGTNYW